MAQIVAFDCSPGQSLDVREGERAPEARHGKAIGHASPVAKARSVIGEPVAEVLRKKLRPLTKARGTLVARLSQRCVDEAIKMHRKGTVVVELAPVAVAIPAVTDVEAVELVEIGFRQMFIMRDADVLQS